jgi:hypothetical protein
MSDVKGEYFFETAKQYLCSAESAFKQRRLAKAQDLLREARYWAIKVPERFTTDEFNHNLKELELKITRGY